MRLAQKQRSNGTTNSALQWLSSQHRHSQHEQGHPLPSSVSLLLCLCLSATARGDDGSAVEKDSLSALSPTESAVLTMPALWKQYWASTLKPWRKWRQSCRRWRPERRSWKLSSASRRISPAQTCPVWGWTSLWSSTLCLTTPVPGYDKHTGIFRVPAAGTYVLSLNIQRHGSDQDTIIMAIRKGGHNSRCSGSWLQPLRARDDGGDHASEGRWRRHCPACPWHCGVWRPVNCLLCLQNISKVNGLTAVKAVSVVSSFQTDFALTDRHAESPVTSTAYGSAVRHAYRTPEMTPCGWRDVKIQ